MTKKIKLVKYLYANKVNTSTFLELFSEISVVADTDTSEDPSISYVWLSYFYMLGLQNRVVLNAAEAEFCWCNRTSASSALPVPTRKNLLNLLELIFRVQGVLGGTEEEKEVPLHERKSVGWV